MRTQTSSVLTEMRHDPRADTVPRSSDTTWYAIRGATTVERDERDEILAATRDLLERIRVDNRLSIGDIVSAFFVVTRDLTAAYPAEAARQLGWTDTALLCASDMDVAGSLKRCIRVLMHVCMQRSPQAVRHVYLEKAASLRPDWSKRAALEHE